MRPTELLIYVLLFAAILLFNYVVQRIGRWQKQQELPPPELPPHDLPQHEPERRDWEEETFGRGHRRAAPPPLREPVRARRAEAPLVAPAVAPSVARRRAEARSFLTGRRNLRRAVIAMTVLGPCRAQQPHEFR
jgi:hypothetical protein